MLLANDYEQNLTNEMGSSSTKSLHCTSSEPSTRKSKLEKQYFNDRKKIFPKISYKR